jgi:Domain of unknown function (DUF5666)
MNKLVSIAIGAAIAAFIVSVSPVAAAAPAQGGNPPPPPGGPSQAQRGPVAQRLIDRKNGPRNLVNGMVKAVNGNALVLQAPRGEITVQTTNATSFYAPGVASAALGNVKAGDRVAVLIAGQSEADRQSRTLTAKAVSVLPLREKAIVAGDVSDISASGFKLTGPRKNSGSVTVTAATKIVVAGKSGATLADIQNGDKVAVQGEPTGNQNITAALIVARPDSPDAVAGGVLASINGSSLVIFSGNGEQLTVDASQALVFERGSAGGKLSDLRIGGPVAVLGIRNSDGTMTAQLIGQGNLPLLGGRR